MNRSIIVLLSIIAVSTAQFTCFSNSSTFSAVCVGVNPACTWTNSSLWTNCNNNFPSSSAYSADIFGSNFTMTVNTGGPVATIDNVVFNVNFGTLAIQSDVNTGNVTIQSGTISVVNSTVNATGDSLDVEGGALYMSESNFVGTLNVMDSGSATVAGFNTFTGAVNNFGTVNILAQSTNQFSSLVTNNGSFIIDAPANVGGAGSLVSYGPITINAANNQLAASVSLNSVIYGQITVENSVLDTRAPQSFYATGINVLNGASVVLANGAFASFSNISNNGTINWVAGNNTIVNANGAFNNWGLFNFTTESDSPLLNSHVTIVNAGNFNIYSDDATVQVPSIDLYGTLTVNGAGVTITGQSSVAGVNETVPYATININGGVIAGGADDLLLKSDVNWSQGNMTVDAAQVLGLVNITGSEYKLLTTTLTAGSVQISGALQLETAYTNGVINNLGSVLMGNGATIYSTTQQTITNVGNNVTSAIMEGSFNLNGVNVVNSGIIGGINVPTTLNIVDGYLTLTPTSQLILGVGQSSTPAIMFTLSNVTSNATKVGATIDGSLTIVILPTFTPTNGNYTVFGTSGQPNINLIGGYNASNVNVTVLEGANANNCNYTVTPGANNYEITVVFSNCQEPSSPASKTWIIIVVVVVVVVVIAAIVGVVLYRRRNHASASEKQRLI